MPTSRRNFVFFLGIGGATIASLTAAGFLYRAADRGSFSDLREGKVFTPWQDWREQRLSGSEAVVLAGTLASSSMNSQPWMFRMEGDIIDLYFRRTSYPVFLDPFDREALMGLGACIENMVTGAQGLGYPTTVALFPSQTNIDHVARLVLGAGAPNETPRFLAIANRHTNRAPYDPERLPPPGVMAALNGLTPSGPARLSLFSADSQKGQDFARATTDAMTTILADPAMRSEYYDWFRQTMEQIRATGNGLSFLTSSLSDFQIRIAMALPDIGEKDFGRFWRNEINDVQVPNTPLFGIITVQDYSDPAQIIEAGRLLQRLHLEATAQGLGFQALSYVNWLADRELARSRSREYIDRALALSGNLGSMVCGLRAGYAQHPANEAPRQPLPNVLVPRIGPRPSPRPEGLQGPHPRLGPPPGTNNP